MFGTTMCAPSVPVVATCNGDGNNGYGYGDGWWVLIILFALFGGWGNRGFGGFGGGQGCDAACATVGDVERGFNQQATNQRFNAIDNAFAQVGYRSLEQSNATNQGIAQLGYQLQGDFCNLGTQLQQCCCDTQRAIDGVSYNMAQGFCNLGNTVQSSIRDVIDNQNANYRALHDEIVANRMEDKNAQIQSLQSQVQALNLAQSQANQNTYLISQLRPTPVPAYTVANPYAGFGYGCCGTAQTCCC